jgi:hypothetical protein
MTVRQNCRLRPFAADFGREKDFGIVLERVDGLLLVHRRQPSVKHADAVTRGRERYIELFQRRAEAREDDLLLRRPARQIQQCLNLG